MTNPTRPPPSLLEQKKAAEQAPDGNGRDRPQQAHDDQARAVNNQFNAIFQILQNAHECVVQVRGGKDLRGKFSMIVNDLVVLRGKNGEPILVPMHAVLSIQPGRIETPPNLKLG